MLKNIIKKVKYIFSTILIIEQLFDDLKINQGTILAKLNFNTLNSKTKLEDFEFRVFSQQGEDGIIQFLTSTILIKNKTFIEFGVGDFFESNCRFLMMKDDWKGFVIDGSKKSIQKLKNSYFYCKFHLGCLDAFITKENINDLLNKSGFDYELGILSVDLDGNYYYILDAIEKYNPCILICEYNPYFGDERKISIPYQEKFQRTEAHYSNLYWGASYNAIKFLANKRGYVLIGSGSQGSNSYFVREDLINDQLAIYIANAKFSPCNSRESRDIDGKLTYITGDQRINVIKGLPVFEVEMQILETI